MTQPATLIASIRLAFRWRISKQCRVPVPAGLVDVSNLGARIVCTAFFLFLRGFGPFLFCELTMPNPIPGPHVDVYPNSDADRLLWGQNLADQWSPAPFNTVLPLADALATAIGVYESALLISSLAISRTPSAITEKDQAWATFAALARSAVRSAVGAYRSGQVLGSSLSNLGIRIPDLIPTTIPAPAFAPLLGIASVVLGSTQLRLTQVVDGAPVNTRGFPYGIRGVEISRRVGSGDWFSVLQVRRVKIAVDTSSLGSGGSIDYRARYISMRGEPGPWSDTVGAVVLG